MFNVRVYGILFDAEGRLLISDEFERELSFTKLPGGGLEQGEGTVDGLKREYMEECQLQVEVIRHFYTTDFFVKSVFNDTQVISIYYLIRALEQPVFRTTDKLFDFEGDLEVMQSFRWVSLEQLEPSEMTFDTEKHVIGLLKKEFSPC